VHPCSTQHMELHSKAGCSLAKLGQSQHTSTTSAERVVARCLPQEELMMRPVVFQRREQITPEGMEFRNPAIYLAMMEKAALFTGKIAF
jgi:hypothetical protein